MSDRGPVHVLIALPVLLVGGTEVQTLSVVRSLIERGYRITLCCYYEFDEDVAAWFTDAGAEVLLLRLTRSSTSSPLLNLLKLVGVLVKMFRERRPDVVHVQYLAPGLIPIIAARLAGVRKLLATVHIAGGVAYGRKSRILLRCAAALCTAFICVSKGVEEFWFGDSFLLQPHSFPIGRRHFTIYNAVQSERIRELSAQADRRLLLQQLGISAAASPVVGIVGRLAEQKGHVFLLNAFAQVAARLPEAVLLVIGEGPLRSSLEQHARHLGIHGSVRWLGGIPQQEVFRYYGAMDVFAMPSIYEGFGLTAAEAMAAGLPVIGTKVDGLSEVIEDEISGYLVAPGDSSSLAERMLRLLTDPDRRRSMGRHGQDRVRELFSTQHLGECVSLVYRHLSTLP